MKAGDVALFNESRAPAIQCFNPRFGLTVRALSFLNSNNDYIMRIYWPINKYHVLPAGMNQHFDYSCRLGLRLKFKYFRIFIMASKLIAQLVVMGTQIVGRAFMDAYRHAAANAGKTAGARAAAASNSSGAAGTSQALNELTRKTGISLEEAMNILNVERTTAIEELEKVPFV
jgi:hypothetical protein